MSKSAMKSGVEKPKRRTKKEPKVEMNEITELLKKASLEEQVDSGSEVQPLLDHLGDYIHEPFEILSSYFEGKPLERLARHQLESYNNFVNYQMQRTIEMFNPITIKSDSDYDEESDTFGLVVKLYLKNLRLNLYLYSYEYLYLNLVLILSRSAGLNLYNW